MRTFYLLITLVFLCGCHYNSNLKKPRNAVSVSQDTLKPASVTSATNTDTITIAAVGDIMLGTSYPNNGTLPPDGAKHSFDEVKDELRNADITFGNLEGVLLDSGAAAPYKLKLRSKPYLFRMPEKYAEVLKDAGFDILSVANNHVSDFGVAGRKSTMQVLDSTGIKYAGLLKAPTSVFTVNGVKYGFCAFSPNSNVVPLLDLKNAAAIIKDLKTQADVVIVSFHGGSEGTQHEHVPFAKESFFTENRGDVHAFAHNAIDAGADLVLGHGPHVTRAIERYNNRFIAYSMGNFCTYRGVSVSGVCGIAPLLKIYINKKGEFLGGKIIPTKQTHHRGLERDTMNKVIKRIKFLTQTDFPRPGLNIADNGDISPVD
ncbi:CapA family protein [Mucilaginibacter limnophilus]|uniref:CapA family protein n=1 Tax=Mucilaginibacter limnophilus TaxID=1932778 RepID=A0A3S2UN08_9SPHI|nr:CapA family protein [Mucilaginibacter limnophilus]RVU01707.1 CapA family protein [Mucilaginibacter limnophilus]